MRSVAPILVVLAACTSNHFRSPAFVGHTAPEPTAVTMVVKCLAEKHDGADLVATLLDGELRKGGDVATLDARTRVVLCDELGNDAILSTMGTDWEAGGAVVGPIAQTLAKRYVAQSILVPLVRSVNRCAPSAAGSNTPLATGCKEERVDVAFLLYNGDGLALWRGVQHLDIPPRGLDPVKVTSGMKDALADVPAVRMTKLPLPQD